MADLTGTDLAAAGPAEFVRRAARLAPATFVPEVSLYQTGDIYALWEHTETHAGRTGLPPPFWGVAWPGGQALARYVLDHPELVAGRAVLDFGSGSGLVAIAAAKAGAAAVVAADTDPLARAAIEANAQANGVRTITCVADARAVTWHADVVLAGDVWYERELAADVSAYLDEAAAAGADVLTGDLGRTYFPRDRYYSLASYEIPATRALEGRELVRVAVWQR